MDMHVSIETSPCQKLLLNNCFPICFIYYLISYKDTQGVLASHVTSCLRTFVIWATFFICNNKVRKQLLHQRKPKVLFPNSWQM